MTNLAKYNESIFESIKHVDEDGNEYWEARELQKALEYKDWRNFDKVINKAIISAKNSTNTDGDWVVEVNKPIKTGKGKEELVRDYKLSRYACYLIVQNGNPRKEVIALGQTYFAVQTRKQELTELEYESLSEDKKRLYQRNLTKKGNYSLNQTAKRKGLRYREEILDNMGSEELVDNLFRITHTESKIKRENVKTEKDAKQAHYEMGKSIRNFIKSQNGTMPEDFPTPSKPIKELSKEEEKNNFI